MADILILNPQEPGGATKLYNIYGDRFNGNVSVLLTSANITTALKSVRLSAAGAATATSQSAPLDKLVMKTNVANAFSLSGVRFKQGGVDHVVKASGEVQRNLSPITGNGTTVGTMTPAQGRIEMNAWQVNSNPLVSDFRGVAGAPINGADTPFNTYAVLFRVATAPLRPGGFSVLGTMQDGTTFNVTADANGVINANRIKGRVNYQTGVVQLVGVTPVAGSGQTATDLSFLNISGVPSAFIDLIRQETLRYNAVAYVYLPLDAELLGIDPVRLPSDGKVPIFRAGGLAVVGHEATTSAQAVSNGQTVNVGRVRVSRVRVVGANGVSIPGGYTENLEAGTVTFTDVSGYSQPVRIEHRIEDMGLIRDAQLDGTITFTRPLTHVYPVGSYVSSCLRAGDLRSRVSLTFDQASWNRTTFNDIVDGDPAPGTYNTSSFPIAVTNAGAITERWALHFKSSTTFDIIGEHVGNIGSGTTLTEKTEPLNPATGQPYMTILGAGFGNGWAVGNLLRINTVGAMFPFNMVRTVQQGPEGAADYTFTAIVRGDVDNPL